ncbi:MULTISPECIES: DUF4232 domain-containing protein [Streptomyces]|uniref:DUF4232 domain-containing protein n=1 Tax=Streptomyces microflavus TaxID=1919 RepID=A0A7H8MMF9_STRMI|nr:MULTISPECIES: DUF4232 domain-containing protein [Streptomyces]MEE1727634.1 DUF4232 domain-containing protein [Streptomyces sp. BE282]OXY93574.1 hypothetical protein BEH93_35430 [Streptomyces sp. 2R]QKW43667.1 DUF4232 domain-containing protein [Streptomyces microflavus]
MRTNRIRTTALAATALMAALSLTACGSNEGTKSAGPAPAAASGTDGKAESTAPQTPETTAHSGTEKAAPASATARTACTTANTTVTVTKVTRPINHLLLTLKNTGSGLCDAYYAPHLGFDGAQSVFPILEDSKPQAVVTLAPGEEAYAGIGLTGEPGQGTLHKSKNLSVHFAKRNGSTYDTPAKLKLPAETYWDDNGFVTYWQSDRATALTF